MSLEHIAATKTKMKLRDRSLEFHHATFLRPALDPPLLQQQRPALRPPPLCFLPLSLSLDRPELMPMAFSGDEA